MPTRTPTLTAADVMTRRLITLKADENIYDAIEKLLRHRISGAPVCEDGRLVGVLSELDALRLIAGGSYTALFEVAGPVRSYMSPARFTVPPDATVEEMAMLFIEKRIRRLPVVDGEELVGQVSRRDVIHGIVQAKKQSGGAHAFPDYRRPT